jgi:[protein-PII] uridylyltransferase
MNAPASIATRRHVRRDWADLIDRGALDRDIAQLRQLHAEDDTAFRRAVVERLRAQLDSGRSLARAWLDADARGLACARQLADLQDELIRAIHHYVVTYVHPGVREKLAIVAVGGYGRHTLAPGSDIDLLFLHPAKPSARVTSIVEAILYVCWDLRQKVGHATRSIEECLRQAEADMTVRTALVEARLIDGDEDLFNDMLARFDKAIVRRTPREFVAAKLAERDVRIRRAGSSRYVVEPNVKEGKGGLRDLNTLFWIAKYVYRVPEAEQLVAAGLFTPGEFRLFRRCEDFLWCVRCHLHFLTGRAEDRLSFDFQRAIAERLGYVSRGGMSGIERFMKHYFLIAKDVGDLTAIVSAALEERQAKPPAKLDRFMASLRPRRKIKAMGDFAIEVDRISVARPDVFERDPVNLIRLFWVSSQTLLPIHPHATRLVTLSLKRIKADVRNDPEANRLFLAILTSRNAPETVLRRMNESGVLGRFIPDFGRVVAMMQFNMYHHYTVDEHLLRAVGVLSEIDAGRLKDDHPLAISVMPTIANRTALYVALFLHDIGKGRDEDHSIYGAGVARRLCPRLGLSEAETETVAWLIEHHLVMSTTAQSRDLSDRRTITTFAETVQTLERLKMLLVLTVADIRAVGPGVWNGWKGQLLRTLYWETEVVLAGGHSTIERKIRVTQAQEDLRRNLPHWSEEAFSSYSARHYPPYWLKVEVARKVTHAELLLKMAVDEQQFATEVATDAFRGVTELTVVAPDHPRLLSIIAGACATAGANIVDAQIFTTVDGLALDTIFISRAFDLDEDELRRAARVASGIDKALRGEIWMGEMVAAKAGPKGKPKTFILAPEVIVDNSLSSRHTVLEVSGLDRPGLLYDLTNAISKLNLNIASAHIATFGEKAVDVFYVTDLTGAKVTSHSRQATIRKQLTHVFGAETEPRARRIGA